MKPQICLGTAQFGLDYGVTNTSGKLLQKTIAKILSEAQKENISMLDTASAYGDAEKTIGQIIGKKNKFKILSKFPSQKGRIFFEEKDISFWEEEFQKSLINLNTKKLDTFFVHDTNDLSKKGNIFLKDWLKSLKTRNLVKRLGVSIYDKDELNNLPYEFLEAVQLPLSIYNQKLLLDGTIVKLKNQGSSIFLRSLFLQGLLVSQVSNWPKWIKIKEKKHHDYFCKFAQSQGYELSELCLDFAKKSHQVEAIILGFTNNHELREVCNFWKNDERLIICDYEKWSLSNEAFIDPRNWPS